MVAARFETDKDKAALVFVILSEAKNRRKAVFCYANAFQTSRFPYVIGHSKLGPWENSLCV
jgi:hypothetical protein